MIKLNLKKVLLAAVAIMALFDVQAQLSVNLALTPDQMVQNLVGNGVQISNVVVTACDSSYGYYQSVGTEIGTSQGLLLTTGKAAYAIGPNNSVGNCSTSAGTCDYFDNGCPGSALLNQAQDRTTYDATQFEFDIIPQGDSIKFKYTFASEEYNEWVNSQFNDVFGFYISGPGIGTDVNIALIPTTGQVVAINTVNALSNQAFYYNNQNPLGQFIQYDGFTRNLIAKVGNLIPCETYHLKLVIADGTDHVFDSGVFIQSIESNPVLVTTATSNGLEYMVEGCSEGSITFTRQIVTDQPQDVVFFVGGTATNGVDYAPAIGSGTPLTANTIVIPANEASVSITIDAVADIFPEGQEYITIFLANPLCSNNEVVDSINFYINDDIPLTLEASEINTCIGACVTLTATVPDSPSSTYTWSANIPAGSDPVVEVCPTQATTYSVEATVGECVRSEEITINVSSIALELSTSPVTCDGGSNGSVSLIVRDALEPYTFSWTGPGNFTSTADSLTGVQSGEYCVTVTDAAGCVNTACIDVIESNQLNVTATLSDYTCNQISCNGFCDGSIGITVTGGIEPYDYSWSGPNGFVSPGTLDANNLCAGTYEFTLTDAVGCEFTNSYTLTEPSPLVIEVVGKTDLLCSGVETGEATVTASGGCTPYTFIWSHTTFVTGPIATDLASGTYEVSVTDQNNCAGVGSVTIVINEPVDPLRLTLNEVSLYSGGFNVSCPLSEDGFVNITPELGTPPYSIVWTNSVTDEVITTNQNLENVSCGLYTATITDANDCVVTSDFDLSCVPEIDIVLETVGNPCGSGSAGGGTIDIISLTGGNGGPYTTTWTGPDCAPCTGTSLTDLNSGDYTVEVTDSEGCTQTASTNVSQNDSFVTASDVVGESCPDLCDGSINLTITDAVTGLPATGTYTYIWSGPFTGAAPTTQDVIGLCPGEYAVFISNGDCEETQFFTVPEADPILIDVVNLVNPTCFGQNNGSINIEVLGGSGNFTYQWLSSPSCFFFGATTQDISNLSECSYTVSVTDSETGCNATSTIILDAPEVMQLTVQTSQFDGGFNLSCFDSNDGSISVSVIGGTPDPVGFAPYTYLYDWITSCSDVDPSIYGNDPNAPNADNLPGGTYGINVTDANGCLATTCIDMIPPDSLQSPAIIQDITCLSNEGCISPNLQGGSNNYVSYQWSGNIGGNPPNSPIICGLQAGNYSLTVTDSNGCIETFDYEIADAASLESDVQSITAASCFSTCDGTATLTLSGGAAPFTATLDGSAYTGTIPGTIENLCQGSHEMTITDVNGCETTVGFIIDSPEELVVAAEILIQEADQVYTLQCSGDTTGSVNGTISGGSQPYDISWTDEIGNVLSLNEDISSLSAGGYCLNVVDADGCTAQECVFITEPEIPFVVTSVYSQFNEDYNLNCANSVDGYIDLTALGGVEPYAFDWANNVPNDTLEDQFNLGPGFYDVVIMDANYCQISLNFEFIAPPPISVDPGIVDVSCNGVCDGQINSTISGIYPDAIITWVGPDGFLSNDIILSDLCAGEYTINIADVLSGCAHEELFTINDPEALAVTLLLSTDCATGSVSACATATGGVQPYNYDWSNLGNTDCVDVTTSGDLSITVTDANGCPPAIADTLVSVPTGPLTINGVDLDASCGACNGNIDVTVTGGSPNYTYQWANGEQTEDLANLCEGFYSIIVSDALGCFEELSFEIEQALGLVVNLDISDVLCGGDSTGTVSLTTNGGTPEFTYDWSDSQGNTIGNESSINGLPAGNYSVSVSDAGGCDTTATFSIDSPVAMSVTITVSEYSIFTNTYNISSPDGDNGTILVEVENGTPDYTYNWTPNSIADTVSNPTGLTAGDYALQIIDANGCTLDTVITLVDPDALKLYTALSPNGDNFNDTYVIDGVQDCPDNKFKVFNRWGNMVYEKDSYLNDWYGQDKDGNTLSDGTYFVLFEGCGQKFNTYVDLRRN